MSEINTTLVGTPVTPNERSAIGATGKQGGTDRPDADGTPGKRVNADAPDAMGTAGKQGNTNAPLATNSLGTDGNTDTTATIGTTAKHENRRVPGVFRRPGDRVVDRRRGEIGLRVVARREPTYDALCLGLKAALGRIAPSMGRVASRLVAVRGWVPFGFARCGDFARERLDRTGRWVRDFAALGRAIGRFPALEDALLGRDGGFPIGVVAAVTIGRITSERSIHAWIELARCVPVRQFKDEARRARETGREWPGERAFSTGEQLWKSRSGYGRVRMSVPAPIKMAFDETHELHRAVCGGVSGVAGFVSSLVGEAYAGPYLPCPDVFQLPMTRDWAALEALLFQNTKQWRRLDDRAVKVLVDAGELIKHAGSGGPRELCRQLQRLIEVQDRLEKELGRVLVLIGQGRGWSKLGFAGLGHYAEQRLGISRTTARDRVRLYRALWRYPVLRRAYEQGRVRTEAALLLLRVLANGNEECERAWVERAQRATLKRLRDEVRGRPTRPLSDEQWFGTLCRAPGDAKRKVKKLGMTSMGAHWEVLELTLPEDLAAEFLAAVEGWRMGIVEGEGVAAEVARAFSDRGRAVPQWVGLLAMLEDFVQTWDDPEGMPKRRGDRIYIRDGWRCTAPGCTSRRNLEDHHLHYRSRGGDKRAEWNRTSLCRFHHQMGEHGGFAKCRGTAPLGILWRLGKEELGTWYRNEMKA